MRKNLQNYVLTCEEKNIEHKEEPLCCFTCRGATPPRVEMSVRLLPWLSATSSGVPRLDGLRVVTLVDGSLVLGGEEIRLDVVPAGAPINSWNWSSGGWSVFRFCTSRFLLPLFLHFKDSISLCN